MEFETNASKPPKNSNTLKKHPKMDLNKADMLQLLSYLEGELQARDVSVAVLYTEKVQELLRERLESPEQQGGTQDPLAALQRDTEMVGDHNFGEEGVRSMYDDQLASLDELILAQKLSQRKMKEMLVSIEKRYNRTTVELDEVKRKHASEVELDDNLTYILEREREKLRQELEFEKSQAKKFEKDLKHLNSETIDDDAKIDEYKQIAVQMIKEQTKMMRRISLVNNLCSSLQKQLEEERLKAAEITKAIEEETLRHMHAEAMFEKQFSEFDFEREQLKLRLSKAEAKHRELVSHKLNQNQAVYATDITEQESNIKNTKKSEISKISLQSPSANQSVTPPYFSSSPTDLKKLSPAAIKGSGPPIPPNKPHLTISNQPGRLSRT